MKFYKPKNLIYIESSGKYFPIESDNGRYHLLPVFVRDYGVVNVFSTKFIKLWLRIITTMIVFLPVFWFLCLMALPYSLVVGGLDELVENVLSVYNIEQLKMFYKTLSIMCFCLVISKRNIKKYETYHEYFNE